MSDRHCRYCQQVFQPAACHPQQFVCRQPECQRQRRREAALLKAHAVNEDLRDVEERIARDVRVAWANAGTAYQQIGVADQLENQAKLALALAQGRYNIGLGSIVELSQAQLNETQAQIQDVNAGYDFQSRYAALQYQVGILH